MSDELLNRDLLLGNEDLDVEGHAKKSTDEPAEDNDTEVEGHLLEQDLNDLL